jgi:OPA family hexose phosphate transport protein UhpT-like MFS transporter
VGGGESYLLGDSFAKIGMGMMADKKLTLFGQTGWDATFTSMYLAAAAGAVTVAYVAYIEERRIRAPIG